MTRTLTHTHTRTRTDTQAKPHTHTQTHTATHALMNPAAAATFAQRADGATRHVARATKDFIIASFIIIMWHFAAAGQRQ